MKMEMPLRLLASPDGLSSPRSVSLPESAQFQIGAAGGQVVLVELDAPHGVVVMDTGHRTGRRVFDEVDFVGDHSGRTVALTPLAIGDFALITIVDQASTARTVRFLNVNTGTFRDSRIDIPMALVSVDPSGWLYAIRETRGRELLTFSWSLHEHP
jgi:hypothetical protein